MNISCEPRSIRILSSNGNRLATASITIDGAFVVRNLSLMNGSKGMFVNMPSRKVLTIRETPSITILLFRLPQSLEQQYQRRSLALTKNV